MSLFQRKHKPSAESTTPMSIQGGGGTGGGTAMLEDLRQTAKHRLIGAVILVLLAILLFSSLLDTKPRPVAADLAITAQATVQTKIPQWDPEKVEAEKQQWSADQNGAGKEVAVIRTEPDSSPTLTPTVPSTSTGAKLHAKPSNPGTEIAKQNHPSPGLMEHDRETKTTQQAQTLHKPAQTKTEAPVAKVAAANPVLTNKTINPVKPPASKAKPLLKSTDVASGDALDQAIEKIATAPAASGKRSVVHIGSFQDEQLVRNARAKAQAAGIPTYTQIVDTTKGRFVRVRVGPFANPQEAQKSLARAKAAGLTESSIKALEE